MVQLQDAKLVRAFVDGDVSCYRVEHEDFINRYYVVSEKESRKLLFSPEVVGYEVYNCLLAATCRMMRHFRHKEMISSANILSILRGALNYPLEESCYREGILVHDISFLSSERIFQYGEIAGLEIKYNKLATVPDSTLMIGDIIASGDTLVQCLQFVIDKYKEHGIKLRNILFFTIGGTKGITLMEEMTKKIREFWPDFEGFITVYYEGVFSCYQEEGITGIQVKDVDFYWKDGILAPEYRLEALARPDVLFEKCVIYDGGARRYEIADHVKEVLEYWTEILERADQIDLMEFTMERLGHEREIGLEDWKRRNHYSLIDESVVERMYLQEWKYVNSMDGASLRDIAMRRIAEITEALKIYMA